MEEEEKESTDSISKMSLMVQLVAAMKSAGMDKEVDEFISDLENAPELTEVQESPTRALNRAVYKGMFLGGLKLGSAPDLRNGPAVALGILVGIEMVRALPLYCRDFTDDVKRETVQICLEKGSGSQVDDFTAIGQRVVRALETLYHPNGED